MKSVVLRTLSILLFCAGLLCFGHAQVPLTGAGNTVPFAPCTGGTRTASGGNTIITFTSSGTLTCRTSFTAQILVVAGGGHGGAQSGSAGGGGGGGGGYCTTEGTPTCGLGSRVTIPSGATTVTVGTAGANNAAGGNSVLGTLVNGSTGAVGGGGGKFGNSTSSGIAGGSGGGAGGDAGNAGTGGGTATSGQGNSGGTNAGSSSTDAPGGGGGGASVAGGNATTTVGGSGGNGFINSITGTAVSYAARGGGGTNGGGGTAGAGGSSGAGGAGSTIGNGSNANAANYGSGGGGGADHPALEARQPEEFVIVSCTAGLC